MSTLTKQPSDFTAFEKATSRWGPITMLIGLVLSLLGPGYLIFFTDLQLSFGQIGAAYAAVASAFLVFAIVEPLTYFPILGQAAMYQAFMIGNISNKLLPAAVVAQDTIDAQPGTKKGDLAATTAISGAAMVHLLSLLIFVGFLGTWLLNFVPENILEVVRLYILPAILGAVIVQAITTVKQPRITVIALAISLVIGLIVVPLVPVLAGFATAICVALTIIVAWLSRSKNPPKAVSHVA